MNHRTRLDRLEAHLHTVDEEPRYSYVELLQKLDNPEYQMNPSKPPHGHTLKEWNDVFAKLPNGAHQ